MKNKIFTLLLTSFIVVSAFAQEENFYYENAVYKENIKTVLAYREGFSLSNPILGMNENLNLVFKFDDLSPSVKDYYYTVVHCDADWNESFLPQSEYIDGFAENPVDDYAFSYNTIFEYINYQITLPNENIKLKYSGNYALVVYEDGDKENKVFTQRFYVYENKVSIEGSVNHAMGDAFKGTRQQVDFIVNHSTMEILNPREEVKVVLMQNNRWDNAIRDLKPQFVRDRILDYNYSRENIFFAGNEFRYFDIRTNTMNGENVIATDFHRPYFHKTLKVDQIRSNKRFFLYEEMNGKYSIESQDEEVDDSDTGCDYVFVHFTLQMDAPLLGGSINVIGGLTNWNINKSNEMTYNFDNGNYELSMLLKQGYYNYLYAYVPQGSSKADHTNIEGSFWETKNDYQILVYYRDLASRYDRLIGYTQLD
jgi:hypothetical protein